MDLARAAYEVHQALGLQRARVRSISLRAEALKPAAQATRQLAFDSSDDKRLAIEAVIDRLRARYAQSVVYPAALAISARSASTSPHATTVSPDHRSRADQPRP
ncbi:hypothetical protein ABZ468_08425 [Streptomyces sp. NPDC005708]|uniref:hypothetical protein n=1 Tax=Streptomyces sp. NPDC005708 TaxID=3154564 RepID=UPI0034078B22